MNVLTVDYRSPDASKQFAKSLHETGFAVLRNHPIPWSMVEKTYQEWEKFFHHPERFNYPFDHKTQEGYVPASLSEKAKGETYKDLKEFYQLYYPWGRYPHLISEVSRQLFDHLFSLGKELMKWIEENLPQNIRDKMPIPMSEMPAVDCTMHRILYYPAQNELPENGIRAAAHEDINLITLLPAANDKGLEVKDRNGNWLAVNETPETLVINVGDMLQEMTDFYYISTTHRVVNPAGEAAKRARMSMPMFVHPARDLPLSQKYPTAGDYLNERLRELGLKS